MKHFTSLSFASTLFAFVGLPTALALDGDDFAQKLADVVASNGMIVEMGNVVAAGDTVTISGFTFHPPAEDPAQVSGDIVFTNVRETNDGGYTAGAANVAAFTFTDDELTVDVGKILVEDIVIPADAKADPLANITLYGRIVIGAISGTADDTKLFSIDTIELTNRLDADGKTLRGDFTLDGLNVDLHSMSKDGPDELAMAQALGLEAITARISGTNVWHLDTGILSVEDGHIDIADIGKLTINGEVHGYDEEMVSALYELQQKMAENPDWSEQELEANSEEILDIMGEKLSLANLSIRFDDASITGKILAMIAAQSGTTPDVMATGLASTLPLMAAQFGAPTAVQTMLADAATTYLNDPQNIEISVEPATAVPLMETMVAVMDPSTLISLFNLSIKANQ